MMQTTVFSIEEGKALRFLQALVASGETIVPQNSAKIETTRFELLTVFHERLSRASLRFLWNSGGYREQTVLRNGTRLSGRLCDATLNQGFSLVYSEVSIQFWLSMAKEYSKLSSGVVLGRQRRKVLRQLVSGRTKGPGDWIFFLLAYQNLQKFELSGESLDYLTRQMRELCPLVLLLTLSQNTASIEGDFLEITAPGAVRVLECIEDVLVASWENRIETLMSSLQNSVQLAEKWRTTGKVLGTYLTILDRVRRMDLATSIMRLFSSMVNRLISMGGEGLRERVSKASGVRTMAQREELIQAVAEVINLGPRLLRQRDELATARYGDERYEESQVFLRHAETFVDPIREPILALSQGLSGIIG